MKNSTITFRLSPLSLLPQFTTLILYISSLCLPRESTLVYAQNSSEATKITTVDVGLILDLDTWVGKMGQSCISMALSDFYYSNPTYKTRLVLHTRDSKKDIIEAASSAIDLLLNVRVKALLGLQKSFQAEFVANLGTKSLVPVVSFSATSPELSSVKTPYLVRTALNDSCQVKAIGDIIKACGWREVAIMYENSDYGRDSLPYIVDAIQEANARVPYRSVISSGATDEQISGELYKLMSMQTRVFVVHVSCTLGSRLFMKIKEVGMMRKGYAWIITEGLTELLTSMNSSVIESMQGVLGVKPYVPRSRELDNFTTRWRRKFLLDHPDANGSDQLSIFGLWAYDSIRALAMASEEVYPYNKSSGFKMLKTGEKSTGLEKIGVSQLGPELLKAILGTSFTGLSGEFKLVDGQQQSAAFQIVNLIGSAARVIGFWTPTNGLSQTLESIDTKKNSNSMDNLRAIIWPGESTEMPKGWEIPTSEKKLRIGVPVKQGFTEFLKVERNANSEPKVTGFVIDVFKEVMDSLPYSVPYEFVPYEKSRENSSSDYNDMVYEVYLQIKDAVVGDTTIVANRSLFVDFPLPFSESGVAMVVPIKDDARKNAWIFLKPLTRDLWLTIGAFFILTGLVIWVLEHRVNSDFRGQPSEQIGTIFFFSFSTLVFAQKEKVMSNLSRFVMIIWLFVVLIITSSYTASLTSLLTVQQLQPTVTDIKDLIKNGDYVGYQSGSFVAGLMESLNFDPHRLKAYNNAEEYRDALDKGSQNGGVAAIVDEIPYIKLFMAKYCTSKYTIIGPTYKTAGFGFAFPKGSPLVPDISRAILSVTEGDKMIAIEKRWFGNQVDCLEQRRDTNLNSDSLSLDSFLGLFFIAGFTSISAFLIFVIIFLRENKNILASQLPVRQKLASLCKEFDKKKQKNIKRVAPSLAVELCNVTGNNDSAHNDEQQQTNFTAIICPSPDVISQLDQGFSSAEPSSPDREHPSAVEIT